MQETIAKFGREYIRNVALIFCLLVGVVAGIGLVIGLYFLPMGVYMHLTHGVELWNITPPDLRQLPLLVQVIQLVWLLLLISLIVTLMKRPQNKRNTD